MSVLIDSGASRDFISQQVVEMFNLTTEQLDSPFGVTMADGRTVNSGRIIRGAKMNIGPFTCERDLLGSLATFFPFFYLQWTLFLESQTLDQKNPVFFSVGLAKMRPADFTGFASP